MTPPGDQLELNLPSGAPGKPLVVSPDQLADALQHRGWVRAKTLQAEHGWSDRACRAAAEAADGQVISGNEGYCLLGEATADEIRTAAARLESQARHMLRRALRIRTRAHRRLHKPEPTTTPPAVL